MVKGRIGGRGHRTHFKTRYPNDDCGHVWLICAKLFQKRKLQTPSDEKSLQGLLQNIQYTKDNFNS